MELGCAQKWRYDCTIMMSRTQISLPRETQRRAKARAAEQGISLAEYVRRAIDRELAGGETPAAGDITAIFGLFDSGDSDIAAHKDAYVGDAVEAEWMRETGRSPRSRSS